MLVDISANGLLTMMCLLDMGASPNLVNNQLLQLRLKKCIRLIKSPPLRRMSGKMVIDEVYLLCFIRIGDLWVCTLFGIVENIAVDELLGQLFIDQCITRVFPAERQAVPLNTRKVAKIPSKSAIISIYTGTTIFKVNRNSLNDTMNDEIVLCTWHVRSRYRCTSKRHFYFDLKASRSRRLRPTEISCNADVPWPCKVMWIFYLRSDILPLW